MKESNRESVLVLHSFKNMVSFLFFQFTGSGETSLRWFSWSGLLFWHYKGCWCLCPYSIGWKTLPSSGSWHPYAAFYPQSAEAPGAVTSGGSWKYCLGVQMIRIHPASALRDGRREHICCPPLRDAYLPGSEGTDAGRMSHPLMLPPAQNVLCFCFISTVLCFATLQCHWGPLWLHGIGMFQHAVTN